MTEAEERRAFLVAAGTTIYGQDWQRPLARGLGPLHPDGAREAIDDRLVRRWVSAERDVPEWVAAALRDLARDALVDAGDRIEALRALAAGRLP